MPALLTYNDPGHAHFLTFVTSRRIPLFLTHDLCQIVLDDLDHFRRSEGYLLVGYVIMPDHVHVLLYPEKAPSITRIVQLVKRHSAQMFRSCLAARPASWADLGGLVTPIEALRRGARTSGQRCLRGTVVPSLNELRTASSSGRGEVHEFWQPGFYDFNAFSPDKIREKLDYIHANPVAWGLVESPEEYPYSSYGHYADCGKRPCIDVDDLPIG